MTWQMLVVLIILIDNISAPILIKLLGQSQARERALVLQYLFCAAFSWLYFWAVGGQFQSWQWLILIIGVFNGFACYCQWRAFAISLSKASALAILDDFISLLLINLVIYEVSSFNSWLWLGLLCSMTAGALFALEQYRSVNSAPARNDNLTLWVLGFTLIWGLATFSMRYFAAAEQVSRENFILAWYSGSLIGAAGVYQIVKQSGKTINWLAGQEYKRIFCLSAIVWLSMYLFYWAVQLKELSVVKPIFLISAIVLPIIIGFVHFGEAKGLSRMEKIGFILALIGGLTMAVSASLS